MSWVYLASSGKFAPFSRDFSKMLDVSYRHRRKENKEQPFLTDEGEFWLVNVIRMTMYQPDTEEERKIERRVSRPNLIKRMFSTHTMRTMEEELEYYKIGINNTHEATGTNKQVYKQNSDAKNVFSVVCQCGNKSARVNQDNFFACTSEDGLYAAGVFDGHGPKGHEVSASVAQSVLKKLALLRTEVDGRFLMDMWDMIQTELSLSDVPTFLSGTTGSIVVKDGDQFWMAQTGDSTIVILQDEGEMWSGRKVCLDHRCGRMCEMARITEIGGEVKLQRDEHRIFLSDDRWEYVESELEGKSIDEWERHLIDTKREYLPGLAVSRAFGDELAHYAGLTHTPEVYNCIIPTKGFAGILVASDGLWDAFDDVSQVAKLLRQYMQESPNRKMALRKLAACARNRLLAKPHASIDDITCVWMCV